MFSGRNDQQVKRSQNRGNIFSMPGQHDAIINPVFLRELKKPIAARAFANDGDIRCDILIF